MVVKMFEKIKREMFDEKKIQRVKVEIINYLNSTENLREPEVGVLKKYLEKSDIELTNLDVDLNVGNIYRTNSPEVCFALIDLYNEGNLRAYSVGLPLGVGLIFGSQGFPMFTIGFTEKGEKRYATHKAREDILQSLSLKGILDSIQKGVKNYEALKKEIYTEEQMTEEEIIKLRENLKIKKDEKEVEKKQIRKEIFQLEDKLTKQLIQKLSDTLFNEKCKVKENHGIEYYIWPANGYCLRGRLNYGYNESIDKIEIELADTKNSEIYFCVCMKPMFFSLKDIYSANLKPEDLTEDKIKFICKTFKKKFQGYKDRNIDYDISLFENLSLDNLMIKNKF